jgi:hypothetical protein
MFEAESWLWRWLADQPPFSEVGVGIGFVLVLSPSVPTAVALVCTRLEAFAESVAAGRIRISSFTLRSQHAKNEIGSHQLTQQPNQSVQFLDRLR